MIIVYCKYNKDYYLKVNGCKPKILSQKSVIMINPVQN